jgi:DnaJ-class molecular chaperone
MEQMNNNEPIQIEQSQAAIEANPLLAAVPYQCCPLCNGNGQTVADGFTSNVYQLCKVCNGARIIPMHIVDWLFKA